MVKETKDDIKSVLKNLEKAANELGYINISIGDLQIKHIKLCLDHFHKTIPTFSAKRFNKSEAYISGLFKYQIANYRPNDRIVSKIPFHYKRAYFKYLRRAGAGK